MIAEKEKTTASIEEGLLCIVNDINAEFDRGEHISRPWMYGEITAVLSQENQWFKMTSQDKLFATNKAIGFIRKILADKYMKYLCPPGNNGFYLLLPQEHVKFGKKSILKGIQKAFNKGNSVFRSTDINSLEDAERKDLNDTIASAQSLQAAINKKTRKLGF